MGGIPISQLPAPQQLRPKGIADIVICVDCTGSMQPCIEGLKVNLARLVDGLSSNRDMQLDWRIRLIEYRDLEHGEPMVKRDFTTDVAVLHRQLKGLQAGGGGDEPESTLDAILAALQSDWRPRCNKCIVLFTDATTHPKMHSSSVAPGQPRDVDEVINKLYETRARLFLFAPKCEAYLTLATAERVEYMVVPGAKGLDGVNFSKILTFIGKTVTASTEPLLE